MNDGLKRAPKGVNDGNGFAFVTHIGDVVPIGLLPIVGGNIRDTSLAEIYREAKVFKIYGSLTIIKTNDNTRLPIEKNAEFS